MTPKERREIKNNFSLIGCYIDDIKEAMDDLSYALNQVIKFYNDASEILKKEEEENKDDQPTV